MTSAFRRGPNRPSGRANEGSARDAEAAFGRFAVGLWAAVIVTLLRLIQGVGIGGEWGGAILLSMEWGDERRRGFVASLPQMGVPFGLLLSSIVTTLTIAATGDAFGTWGWRIPFLLSLILVAVGLYVRLKVYESPLFQKALAQKAISRVPVGEVLVKHPGEIVWSMLARVVKKAEKTPRGGAKRRRRFI
ncbi:MAG: MFS transporter [Hydrogenibacillus schlegelii]|nr:MFS transporter [Hydrogenibacillus schlegelii]